MALFEEYRIGLKPNMPRLFRDTTRKTILVVSLSSIALPIAVSIIVMSAQISTYGLPVRLLVSLGLVAALVLGSRYAARRRSGAGISWEYSWALAGLTVLAVFLLSNQLLVRGLAVGIWDAEGELYPFQALVSDFARSGRFLYWDPWSNGGIPLAGDPSVGAFSPLNLAVGVLTGGTSVGFRIYWLLVWLTGGFGILMLARQLRAPAWGGAVVALGFLFCGVYTGNAEHTSCIVAFSFLPLVVWRLDHALVSRRLQSAAEAGALWGLSALSGYPALTIVTGLFCVLWAAGRMAFPETRSLKVESVSENLRSLTAIRAKVGAFLAIFAVLLLVGIAVLSPTYYMFFAEGAETNARTGPLNREVAILSNALDPGALSTLSSPYLAALKAKNQLYGSGQMWPATDLSMCSIYSGVVVTAFAMLALLTRPRDRWRWWLILLAALSVSCSLGGALPLRGWLYDWVYPMRFFRHSAIFGFYFVFTLCALALIGFRDFQASIEGGDKISRRFLTVSLICATAAFAVFLCVVTFGDEASIGFKQAMAIWLVVSGVWLAIVGVALLLKFRPASLRMSYFPVILLAIAASDAIITCTVSQGTIASTEADDLARWESLDRRHSSILDLTPNGLMREQNPCSATAVLNRRPDPNPHTAVPCPFSDQLITKIPVLESYSTLTNPFHLRMASHPILKEMAIGIERIWFCNEAAEVPTTEEYFLAFLKRAEALRSPPLLIDSRQAVIMGPEDAAHPKGAGEVAGRIEQLPACDRIPVRVVKYDPEVLAFDCSCPSDGWLLVTDRWGSGWRARVNGESTEVQIGDFIFRAIRVHAGENSVCFSYHPPLFPWLLILSWTTLGCTAVWSLAHAARNRTARSVVRVNSSCDHQPRRG